MAKGGRGLTGGFQGWAMAVWLRAVRRFGEGLWIGSGIMARVTVMGGDLWESSSGYITWPEWKGIDVALSRWRVWLMDVVAGFEFARQGKLLESAFAARHLLLHFKHGVLDSRLRFSPHSGLVELGYLFWIALDSIILQSMFEDVVEPFSCWLD